MNRQNTPREQLEAALASIPDNLGALGVARHLGGRGCRGERHDGRRDALAMYLGARCGFEVWVHADTVTRIELAGDTAEHDETPLPEHVRRFVRYYGRGFYPELFGEPTEGTTGPLPLNRCASRRR